MLPVMTCWGRNGEEEVAGDEQPREGTYFVLVQNKLRSSSSDFK